jgi:uncharacterized membrane protein YdjX (TVP38/TMEM64 family)
VSPELEKSSPAAATRSPSIRERGRKLAALMFWLALVAGYQLYFWQRGITPLDAAQILVDFMSTSAAGPLIFVAFYALSRLVLFPATLLTIASGYVFGPVPGVVLTVLGSNAAASVCYLMGRYFGDGLLDSEKKVGVVQRYAEGMRNNGFESVLLMYLVYAPLDLVGILAGFLRIGWKPFVLATMLGLIPATLSWVLLGASIETDLTGGIPRLEPAMLFASVVLLVGSLLLSRYLRRRTVSDKGTG